MIFDEEFKKLAEEKRMTCSELARKILDAFPTADDGYLSFGDHPYYIGVRLNADEARELLEKEGGHDI